MPEKPSHKYWTMAEEQTLRRIWPASWRALADALPERSRGAISLHAREMGLPSQFQIPKPWSGAENRLLRELRSQGMGAKEIHRRMPQRTHHAIEMQAHRMDMKSIRAMRRAVSVVTDRPAPQVILSLITQARVLARQSGHEHVAVEWMGQSIQLLLGMKTKPST